jgi:hypothetical protein
MVAHLPPTKSLQQEMTMRKLILAAALVGLSAGAAFAQGTNPSAPHMNSTGTGVEQPGITGTGTAVDKRTTTGTSMAPRATGSEAGNNANSIGGPNSAAGNDPNTATGRTSGGGAGGGAGGGSGR